MSIVLSVGTLGLIVIVVLCCVLAVVSCALLLCLCLPLPELPRPRLVEWVTAASIPGDETSPCDTLKKHSASASGNSKSAERRIQCLRC